MARLIDKSYIDFLTDLKSHVSDARHIALRTVNSELVKLYWIIGKSILEKQGAKWWGKNIIGQLSQDMRLAFPEMKGFSPRNLGYMKEFARV